MPDIFWGGKIVPEVVESGGEALGDADPIWGSFNGQILSKGLCGASNPSEKAPTSPIDSVHFLLTSGVLRISAELYCSLSISTAPYSSFLKLSPDQKIRGVGAVSCLGGKPLGEMGRAVFACSGRIGTDPGVTERRSQQHT